MANRPDEVLPASFEAAPVEQGPLRVSVAHTWDFARRLLRVRLVAPSVAVIVIFGIVAALAELFGLPDPARTDASASLSSPSWDHPFGTDQLGRDSFSRMIFGTRIALGVAFASVMLGAAVGVPIGIAAGYFRGIIDDILMRLMDALLAFPGLLLAIALVAVFGPTIQNVIVAIGIANIPWLARVSRSLALTVREQDYVIAGRTIGASHARLMLRYVLPNSIQPVIVQASLGMGFAVLTEAALSFLGIGVRPPTPTWGGLLRDGYTLIRQAWWLAVIPGAAIFLLVLSLNILGDGLRDALDPRLRNVR